MKRQLTTNRKKFTLVELMVVAIIVAILAAVAIPLMTGNVERAIITEAQAALGTIRSNMRALHAEYGDYENIELDDGVTLLGDAVPVNVVELPNMNEDDIDGHYFSWECYTVEAVSEDTALTDPLTNSHNEPTFLLQCDGSVDATDDVPGEEKVTDFIILMYEDGTILMSNDSGTSWEKIQ